jgi:hypothetical protein
VVVSLSNTIASATPNILAFVQSVTSGSYAQFGVSATLVTSSTLNVSASSWSSMTSMTVGYIIIDGSLTDTCFSETGDNIASLSTTYPSQNLSTRSIAFIGLVQY